MARRAEIIDETKVPEMTRRLRDLNGTKIKVGIVGPGQEKLAVIYAANEFGTRNAGRNRDITIPERSTLRATADSKKDIDKSIEEYPELIDLNVPVITPLDRIGLKAAEAVRERIRSNTPPANKPSTIARKGSARTLIDIGTLVGEIKHEVV